MLAVSFSFFAQSGFWISLGISAAIYGLFSLGMQLNIGTTGISNFGQAGFMAIGTYGAIALVVHKGMSLWIAALVGFVAAVIAGVLVGLALLRLRTDYFAIGTLAFAETVRLLSNNWNDVTGGSLGLFGYTTDWMVFSAWIDRRLASVGISETFLLPLLLFSWVVFLSLVLLVWGLSRTPWGRVLKAIRADEDCMRALGKRTTVYKIQSLALSAGLASIAGLLFAINVSVVTPQSFDPVLTVYGLAIVIVGGVGSYAGVVLGSLFLFVILDTTRYLDLPLSDERVASLRFMIVGALLILVIALRPQGFAGKREELELE